MNNKIAINMYLSTIESKIQTKQKAEQKQNHIYKRMFCGLSDGSVVGGDE